MNKRRGGHRRGAMSSPLRTAKERYLDKRANEVGANTLANERRMLNNLARDIESGAVKNLITRNPYLMDRRDIRAIMEHLRARELDNETLEKYLRYLNGMLLSIDNHALEQLKDEAPHLFPKRTKKPIHYLQVEEVEALMRVAESMSGWNGSVTRLLTSMYPATGLRVSELRLAQLEDLDLVQWTIRVREPKGKDSYGYRRTATIMPPFRPAIEVYLLERREHLQRLGKDSKYLIPSLRGGKDVPYSSNHLRKLKYGLEAMSGINFKLKDYRATFASLTVQMDPNLLPDVSKQLGHSSVVVTERYYAATKSDDAGRRLAEAWEKKPKTIEDESRQNQKTDSERSKPIFKKKIEYMSGYA